jgi:membrane protein
LWLLVRWGFGLYVDMVVGQKSLYGALGLLPVFLLWINVGWFLFIFGAELAATVSQRGRLAGADLPGGEVVGPLEVLTAMLAVHLLYARGRGPVTADQIASQAAMTEQAVRDRLDRLVRAGLICPVASGGEAWLPARPAGATCVAEVLAAGDPGESLQPPPAGNREISTALQRVGATARQAIAPMSLADLLAKS